MRIITFPHPLSVYSPQTVRLFPYIVIDGNFLLGFDILLPLVAFPANSSPGDTPHHRHNGSGKVG